MTRYVLGIAAYYHDSSATLLMNGNIVAAAQEERFTRKKHESCFPSHSIKFVLDFAGIDIDSVELVAFYEKPFLKFERLLETYHSLAPRGLSSFLKSMPIWMKEKLLMKSKIKKELLSFGGKVPEIVFPEHHLSHGASAYYPSGFDDAAILTIDAVGEWATTTISEGNENKIKILKQLDFPHSLGLFYSAFTYYCGFKVNSGEYKLMGLAPYGDLNSSRVNLYIDKIKANLITIKEDGSLFLSLEFFDFATGFKMCRDEKWKELFGLARRRPEAVIDQAYMDLALACQKITEEVVLKLTRTTFELTGKKNLVMAGGVALNCVANGKIVEQDLFENIWIQPAAGDAGGSLGAALAGWHIYLSQELVENPNFMQGSSLGPEFDHVEVSRVARKFKAPSIDYERESELDQIVCEALLGGSVVGWFQGRMEFGPRALGNRSILANPKDQGMQKNLNLKIKFREGFRPFAPAVLEEDFDKYFKLKQESPYMLFVAPLREELCIDIPEESIEMNLMERLYFQRSSFPAITHIDYSARVQTVSKKVRPRFWNLLQKYKEISGDGMLVNTSFNVRGEPIVCSPEDAYLCFMRTEMDMLVIGKSIFIKDKQPSLSEKFDWKSEFLLD